MNLDDKDTTEEPEGEPPGSSSSGQPTGGQGTRHFFRFVLTQYPRHTFVASALLFIGSIAEGLSIIAVYPFLVGLVQKNDEASQDPLVQGVSDILAFFALSPSPLVLLGGAVIGIWLKGGLRWLAMRQSGFAAAHVVADLRMRLAKGVMNSRRSFFTSMPMGTIANSISSEPRMAGNAFTYSCRSLAAMLQAFVYLLVMMLVSPQAVLGSLLAGTAIVLLLSGFIRWSRRIGVEGVNAQKTFVTRVIDTVQNVKPIRAMGRERGFLAFLGRDIRSLEQIQRRDASVTEALPSIQDPLLAVCIVGGYLAATLWMGLPSSTLMMLGLLVWRIIIQVNRAQLEYRTLAFYEASFWSLHGLIEETILQAEETTGTLDVPEEFGSIRFRDVTFQYGDSIVLDKVSFSIPQGSLTVLLGPSGEGKTTLLDLILGFHHPSSGEILIGDNPLRDIALPQWRQSVGYVPQEVVLLNDTLFNNVALGDESINRDAVVQALERAGAMSFVSLLDKGLDTVLGERGSMLSGGERQRISIARALVKGPKLLILDEVTASLDPDTAKAVVGSLVEHAGDTTIVAVSHKDLLTSFSDRVFQVNHRSVTQV